MLQQKGCKKRGARYLRGIGPTYWGKPYSFDELMQMTPEEIKANQVEPKREAAPDAGEASTPNKQSLKETGNQQEKRLFAEDRAGGRPAQSNEYHAYEGRTSGSFRQWAQRLQNHINRAFRTAANRPQLNTAHLARGVPEGAPRSTAEGTAAFIEGDIRTSKQVSIGFACRLTGRWLNYRPTRSRGQRRPGRSQVSWTSGGKKSWGAGT